MHGVFIYIKRFVFINLTNSMIFGSYIVKVHIYLYININKTIRRYKMSDGARLTKTVN